MTPRDGNADLIEGIALIERWCARHNLPSEHLRVTLSLPDRSAFAAIATIRRFRGAPTVADPIREEPPGGQFTVAGVPVRIVGEPRLTIPFAYRPGL